MAADAGIAMNQGDLNVIKSLLKGLPENAFAKVVPRAVKKGMDPVLQAAKRKAPTDTGQLFFSLGVKLKKYKRSQTVLAMVGPLKDFKDPVTGRNPANYAHLVELGTAPHKIGNRQHPGSAPRPFLRPALEENRGKATAIMGKEVRASLTRAAKRLAKRK